VTIGGPTVQQLRTGAVIPLNKPPSTDWPSNIRRTATNTAAKNNFNIRNRRASDGTPLIDFQSGATVDETCTISSPIRVTGAVKLDNHGAFCR
jgi:hypothetical protein